MSDSIKVISFNVNGIRARLHQLEYVLKLHKPDVIGLQEIKVSDEDLLTAYSKCANIRQTLLEVGLSPKGGNYNRIYKLISR